VDFGQHRLGRARRLLLGQSLKHAVVDEQLERMALQRQLGVLRQDGDASAVDIGVERSVPTHRDSIDVELGGGGQALDELDRVLVLSQVPQRSMSTRIKDRVEVSGDHGGELHSGCKCCTGAGS